MYKSFEVRDFRCFRELNVTGLERVNLIAGLNNAGKTTLLEALFLHCGAYNPALTLSVNAFRGIESVKVEFGRWAGTPWDSLFSEFDVSKKIELIGDNDSTGRRMLRLKVVHQAEELAKIGQFVQTGSERPKGVSPSSSEVAQVLELEYEEAKRHGKYYLILDPKGIRTEPIPPAPPFPAFFQPARMRIPFRDEAERFSKLQVRGEENVLLEVLQLIEPRLTRLAMAVEAGEPILQGDIGLTSRRFVPLPVMGEGMVRLASLILHIGNAPDGVVLVDEIENGLHHSILPKVWQAIGKVARQFHTQVFATTHSLECIVAAHKTFSEDSKYDFRLHRLERVEKTIRSISYDQETLEAALGTGLEVR